MPSSVQCYSITITNGISNTSPSDGFVDPQQMQVYYGREAVFVGSISGTTLTVSSVSFGAVAAGQTLSGLAVLQGTSVASGSGTTWTITPSQTVPAGTTIIGSGSLETTPAGLTYALCQAKRRGNLRYTEINNQLGIVANCYVDPKSIVNNATATTEASSLVFQIYAEHGDASLVTLDELNVGSYLTSTACITRCVARALTATLYKEIDVFDPTASVPLFGPESTNAVSVPRYGIRVNVNSSFMVGPYASSLANATAQIAVVMV